MDILAAISEGWSWKGLDPVEVVDVNAFGNVIVRARDGVVWRVIPEDADAMPVADDLAAFEAVRADPEFQIDWRMDLLVERAAAAVGPLEAGRCYTLKMPGALGGFYVDDSNLGSASLTELMAFSGSLAQRIDGLPDGAEIQLKIVD